MRPVTTPGNIALLRHVFDDGWERATRDPDNFAVSLQRAQEAAEKYTDVAAVAAAPTRLDEVLAAWPELPLREAAVVAFYTALSEVHIDLFYSADGIWNPAPGYSLDAARPLPPTGTGIVSFAEAAGLDAQTEVDRYYDEQNASERDRTGVALQRIVDALPDRFFGVEALTRDAVSDRVDIDGPDRVDTDGLPGVLMEYANTGETYEPTVIWDNIEDKWLFGVSWGAWLEQLESARRIEDPTEFEWADRRVINGREAWIIGEERGEPVPPELGHTVRQIFMANPTEWVFGHRGGIDGGFYVLWFDQHAPRFMGVWADNLQDALEEGAGALRGWGFDGYFVSDEDMQERIRDAREELGVSVRDPRQPALPGMPEPDESAVFELAEQDLIYTESGYIESDEWGYVYAPQSTPSRLVDAADRLSAALRGEHYEPR